MADDDEEAAADRRKADMENQKIRTHYGEKIVEAKLPDGWNLLGNLETKAFPRIGPAEMMKALDAPIGTSFRGGPRAGKEECRHCQQ